MKRTTSDLICCPYCQGSLSLQNECGEGRVIDGELFCPNCERCYPIENGIPHFVDINELDGLNRSFANSYDFISRFYDLTIKVTFLAFGGDRKARLEILNRLDLSTGRVLEVSIGTGMNLPYLFEIPGVSEVYGLDISTGQLARCQRLIDMKGWNVDLFLGTAEELPFSNDVFESVFHIGGINFFSDKKGAILEMIRVAKPGSKIVIADETERLAQLVGRLPGFSGSYKDKKPDLTVPVHLVPTSMEDIQVIDIWKAHGEPHGFCL